MIRVAIKNEKALTSKLQMNINRINYIQKSSFIYNHMKNVSGMTFFNLKKHYIPSGYLFCGKK